jgi:tRNA modification GTPase
MSDQETLMAWLTPPGRAAIATLAVRGPRTGAVLAELFRRASGPPPDLGRADVAGHFWLGWLGDGGGRGEVVLALKRGGPCPWVEIHCHGGPEVARLLERLLAERGVRVCSWQEFGDPAAQTPEQAAALAALAHALTARTAAILLDQYHGAFGRALAANQLDELVRFIPVGRHLTSPWRVAVLGAPNVGKSSLVNLLTGYQRSVVSEVAGTTRDLVRATIAVDGWPVELIDTAGWRADARDLERQGIDLAQAAAAAADLCLWVLDATAAPQWPDGELPAVHYVVNKTDLAPAWDLAKASGAVYVSARTAFGLPELLQALARWLVPDPPPPGAAVPFTVEWCDWLAKGR